MFMELTTSFGCKKLKTNAELCSAFFMRTIATDVVKKVYEFKTFNFIVILSPPPDPRGRLHREYTTGNYG